MADGLTLRLDDLEVRRDLEQLVRRADNPEAAFHAIGAYMVTATQRRFERETGPDGQPWQRLSPRTAAKRIGSRRRGYENILRVKARLYSSLAYEASADQVAIGTNVEYAAAQQLGAEIQMPAREQDINLSIGKGRRRFVRASAKRKETRRVSVGEHVIRIPARPYLGVDETDQAEIRRIVEDHYRGESR